MDRVNYELRSREAIDFYDQRNYEAAKQTFEALLSEPLSLPEQNDCKANMACCLASLGRIAAALEQFNSIHPDTYQVRYNRALCYYKLSKLEESRKIVDELVEDPEEPEVIVEQDGSEMSHLVESFNLKSAILFKLKTGTNEAVELISRASKPSDHVTSHNRSIYTGDMGLAINDLEQLVDTLAGAAAKPDNGTLIVTAVNNLLRLHLIRGDHQSAIDMIDKHQDELSQNSDLLEFYEILANRAKVSDRIKCKRLELLLDKLVGGHDSRSDEQSTNQIESVTMQLTAILWQNNQYSAIERVLLKVEAILSDREFWPSWYANSLFMQDTRYEECCYLYERLLSSSDESAGRNLLADDAIILANLCVAYLLTGQNNSAEALIKAIEQDELNSNRKRDIANLSHSCIVNLTIGQLYCVKLNFAFGLPRLFKSLEPIGERLSSESWYICKRCILSLIDNHCKSMIYARDDLFDQVVSFLIECERYGLLVEVAPSYGISQGLAGKLSERDTLKLMGRNSVTYEARYLRSLILAVLHD